MVFIVVLMILEKQFAEITNIDKYNDVIIE